MAGGNVAVIIGVIMTYPPQQPPPGPDPYGQPPDPYGQPQWGGTQPGGFPVGPPPPKPKTGLIAALIIGAIVLVGGGGAGAYLLLSKENGAGSEDTSEKASDPKAVADEFGTEFEKVLNTDPQDVSLEPLKPLVCSGDLEKLQGEVEGQKDQDAPNSDSDQTTSRQDEDDADATVSIDDFTSEGDKAKFTMVVGYGERDVTEAATMAKSDGRWQVCGLYENDGDDGGGSTGSSNNEPPPNPVPTG